MAVRLHEIAESASDTALRRTASARRIDLVSDLAAPASYAIITKLYGIPPPNWVTELAPALPFAHQHVGELPPDWVAKMANLARASLRTLVFLEPYPLRLEAKSSHLHSQCTHGAHESPSAHTRRPSLSCVLKIDAFGSGQRRFSLEPFTIHIATSER